MNDVRKTSVREKILKIVYIILPVLALCLLYLGWVSISNNRPELFPTPLKVYNRLIYITEKPIRGITIFGHLWISLYRVLRALAAAIVIGISLGVAIGWSRTAKAIFGTLFDCIRPIPPLAWIPLLTILLGTTELPRIILIFIGAFIPLVINTYTGIKLVEPIYFSVGRIFQANNRQLLTEIAFPSALPTIFAGFRTATGGAWLCVLAAEMLGAREGLGFLITRGMEADDIALIFVSMIFIGITGAVLAYLTFFLERWVCPWASKKK